MTELVRRDLEGSRRIFDAAKERIPGGVNSPVRAYRGVGGTPPHIVRGKGAIVTDVDGNEYVDLVLAYGPLILGHTHPAVTAAIEKAAHEGTAFGAPTEGELRIAEEICSRMAPVEMVRLVNSGTEATMSALRLARAITGRAKFVKFNGCYHGHGDSFLVKAGSGALTLGAPDSPGVPPELAAQTLVAEYNDLASVEKLFAEHGQDISCVFVEPVAGNMGCVLPAEGFLPGLRALCDRHGALLVFDEVMTGFRVSRGGFLDFCEPQRSDAPAGWEGTCARSAADHGAKPDLVTLGKVIGAGLPIGAYGGRADLMRDVSPSGSVYQAGTLSGNPLAVAAGEAALRELSWDAYVALEQTGRALQEGLESIGHDAGVPLRVNRQGSMLCLYFAEHEVHSFGDVERSDRERWTRFFHGMLERGVLLAPSPFEAWFLSTAHDERAISRILDAARESVSRS